MTDCVRLGDLFDDEQIAKARRIVAMGGGSVCIDRLEKEVVLEQIDHIDFVTQQENMPRYFAYALYHALTN